MTIPTYDTAGVIVSISEEKLAEIQAAFSKVHYHPDGVVPDDHLAEVDIWFTSWTGLPASVTHVKQIPRTKVIQLSSAGANNWLARDIMQSKEAKDQIKVCSASGIHTLSIPQYIIANVVNLYMKLQVQLHLARTEETWPARDRVVARSGLSGRERPGNRCLFGKTVGMLGYGHIARETARLFKAFHCDVIAANSKGDKRSEHGYAIPGTGDHDGSIPSQYYSTSDPASFKAFLARCDVLVASLPSTPQTRYMLNRDHFGKSLLPQGAVFVNVGRGDLVKSEEIIAALDAPGGLWGAALDVTDPEPLPVGHPLFTHPAAIVTPHTSGSFEGYFDSGADVLLRQVESLRGY
ncbi:hypothetical protein EHS25_005872 [Saitozyma podzolica]|uniref:D-isomer specific 2-hydroxyacid dehydrogenase NAD-binding domain-containing protein n=1 Tax=Saitozyma podzolica TaxID=1890683 RepID=A0A427XVM5_9TREE|nr:hypothetical protein EHS25_005872 [Saitozyma podzolica]